MVCTVCYRKSQTVGRQNGAEVARRCGHAGGGWLIFCCFSFFTFFFSFWNVIVYLFGNLSFQIAVVVLSKAFGFKLLWKIWTYWLHKGLSSKQQPLAAVFPVVLFWFSLCGIWSSEEMDLTLLQSLMYYSCSENIKIADILKSIFSGISPALYFVRWS